MRVCSKGSDAGWDVPDAGGGGFAREVAEVAWRAAEGALDAVAGGGVAAVEDGGEEVCEVASEVVGDPGFDHGIEVVLGGHRYVGDLAAKGLGDLTRYVGEG